MTNDALPRVLPLHEPPGFLVFSLSDACPEEVGIWRRRAGERRPFNMLPQTASDKGRHCLTRALYFLRSFRHAPRTHSLSPRR